MSEISKIKVITLAPFIASEYHLWTASALATFQVYKVDKLVLGEEQEPRSDDQFDDNDESHLKRQQDWEERNILAIEALLKCLNKVEKTKVFRMTEAAKIWSRLDDEYGHISDMRRNIAETALYTFRKDTTISMEDYINKFTGLIQEIDLHRPKEIPEMSIAQINLTFIRSLGEKYETFYHSISKEIHTMNTAELFARIKVIDALHAKPDEPKTTMLITKTFKPNLRSYKGKGSYRGKGNYRQFRPYQGNYNRFPNNGSECAYCHKRGHTKENCFTLKNNETRSGYKTQNPRLRNKYSSNGNNSYSSPNQSHTYGQYNPFIRAHVTSRVNKDTKSKPANPFEWILDSASNIHLTPFQERFVKYTPYAEPQDIIGLGGMTTQAFGTGTVILHDRQQRKHTIQDVVYVPKAQFPILSLFKLQLDISFSNNSIHLSDRKHRYSL